jgi:dihydrolipoamide dehydrogenase
MADEEISTETEVLIIGGGPGGYVAAIRAGQLGLDATLVEMEAVGGTCLNYGCIPSKALITATDIPFEARTNEDRGIRADVSVDLEEMVGWKDDVVEGLTGGVEQLCQAGGATVVEGRGEFDDENTARITTEDGAEESIEFEHAIVATGSRVIEIPGFEFDGERIISSRGALALESVPSELLVVGAGYIGMELSTVYAKLGADVTVIEALDSALPAYEEDIGEVVRDRAEAVGVDFRFGQSASEWEENSDGGLTLRTEDEEGETAAFDAEKVLVAVGREPVTDTLNLDAVGLDPNDGGFLETDDRARTDLEHVFAVGDVAGEPLLAHKGMAEGEVATEVIAGEPAALDYQAIPAAVFTDPEIGTVGMTEAEAEEAGFDPVVGRMPMQASGRALTLGETEGFVRVVAAADGGFLLGAQVVAPEASELIAELGLAIEAGATLEDVGDTIHTHPTLGEAVMEAADSARSRAIHTR